MTIAELWMALDWLVRVCAPAWLELATLKEHVMALRTAEVIRDSVSCMNIQPLLDAAGAAAGAAAWDALRPTVESLQASALELLDGMIAGNQSGESIKEIRG